MCGETVDDCLEALKLIRNWFLASNMPEKFHDALFANDSILIKSLVKSIFLLMNWLFSAQIFVKLTLMIIIIFIKMILILLFMSNFRLDIISLKRAKHLKKYEELIPVA